MRSRVATCLVGISLSACASTSVSSLKAPEFPTKAYSRVMVVFPVSDLAARKVTEAAFISTDTARSLTDQKATGALAFALKDRRQKWTHFIPSTQLLFPGRAYTAEETRLILKDEQVQAVLLITLHDAGVEKVGSTPVRTSIYCAQSAGANCTNIAAVTTGGHGLTAEWATFRAQLIDIETGNVVWIASSTTAGTPLNRSYDLLQSMAQKTKAQLEADGATY